MKYMLGIFSASQEVFKSLTLNKELFLKNVRICCQCPTVPGIRGQLTTDYMYTLSDYDRLKRMYDRFYLSDLLLQVIILMEALCTCVFLSRSYNSMHAAARARHL